MRANKIKQMWAEGKTVNMGWLSIGHTFTAELMARQGFDSLCVDLQHGTVEINHVLPMLQAIGQTDVSPVVRVRTNEAGEIMKVLDLGAMTVIVPLINTAEDAARAVAACRYPPVGNRSSGPIRALHYGGPDYQAKANDEILVLGMIETKEGLTNLEAICATPGLDAIYIGPADLSLALGLPPQGDNPNELHIATCNKILETAHRHGKKACMHCQSAAFAAGAIKRGFDLVMLGSDVACLLGAARRLVQDYKTAVAT